MRSAAARAPTTASRSPGLSPNISSPDPKTGQNPLCHPLLGTDRTGKRDHRRRQLTTSPSTSRSAALSSCARSSKAAPTKATASTSPSSPAFPTAVIKRAEEMLAELEKEAGRRARQAPQRKTALALYCPSEDAKHTPSPNSKTSIPTI